jgi:hypothetical protein
MTKKIILLGLFLSVFCPIMAQKTVISAKDIEKTIRSTALERKSLSDTATINLYQGNGVFGSSYGPLGLHIDPSKNASFTKYGKTEYFNMHHYVRAKYGADYLIPLAHFYWEKEPKKTTNYSQNQSYYDGTISTHFQEAQNKVTVLTWFDAVNTNLAGIKINVEGKASDLIFKPSDILDVHYDQKLTQISKITQQNDQWKIELSCLNAKTIVYLKTNASVELQNFNLVLKLK